ncbi:hypothetical protein [Cellulomonas sp. P5_E12]
MSTEKTPSAASDEAAPLPVPASTDDTVAAPVDHATPAPVDDTAVIPVDDTTAAPDDTAVIPVSDTTAAPDDTAVIPVSDTTAAPDDTAVIPVDDTTAALAEDTVAIRLAPAAEEVAAVAVEEGQSVGDDTGLSALPLETRALPATDDGSAGPADEPVTTSADGSVPPSTAATPYPSPIGALYAPTGRPEPTTPLPTSAYAQPVSAPYPVSDRIEPVATPVDPTPVDPPRRRLRVGTVVWGLVIAAIGVGLLAWAAGVAIDLQLAMIVLLAVAGTVLLVGSILSGARSARR